MLRWPQEVAVTVDNRVLKRDRLLLLQIFAIVACSIIKVVKLEVLVIFDVFELTLLCILARQLVDHDIRVDFELLFVLGVCLQVNGILLVIGASRGGKCVARADTGQVKLFKFLLGFQIWHVVPTKMLHIKF